MCAMMTTLLLRLQPMNLIACIT
ncbi:hypothetical protein NFI96_033679 [Prochilodus magdalenae]|nr:hypothetical protein NFI96_033679 [Prochilodus magdalenae]